MNEGQLTIFNMDIEDSVTIINKPSADNLNTKPLHVRFAQTYLSDNFFNGAIFNRETNTLKMDLKVLNSPSLISGTSSKAKIDALKEVFINEWVIELSKDQYQEFWGSDVNVDNLIVSSISAVKSIAIDTKNKIFYLKMEEDYIKYNFDSRPGILQRRIFNKYLYYSVDKPILYNFLFRIISMDLYKDKLDNKHIVVPKTRIMDQIEFINLAAVHNNDSREDVIDGYLTEPGGRNHFGKLQRRLEKQINEMFSKMSDDDNTEPVCKIENVVYEKTIKYYHQKYGKRKDYKNGVAIIFPNWESTINSTELELVEFTSKDELNEIIQKADFTFKKPLSNVNKENSVAKNTTVIEKEEWAPVDPQPVIHSDSDSVVYDEYGVRQFGYNVQYLDGSNIYQYFEVIEFEENLLERLKSLIDNNESFEHKGIRFVYNEKFIKDRLRSVYGTYLSKKQAGKILAFDAIVKFLYSGTLKSQDKSIFPPKNNIKLSWEDWVHMAREAKQGKSLPKPTNAIKVFSDMLNTDSSYDSVHNKIFHLCHCQFMTKEVDHWYKFLSQNQWDQIKLYILEELKKETSFQNLADLKSTVSQKENNISNLALFFRKYFLKAMNTYSSKEKLES